MRRIPAFVFVVFVSIPVLPTASAFTVSLNNARPLSNPNAWGTVYAGEAVWMQYTIACTYWESGTYEVRVTNNKNDDVYVTVIQVLINNTGYAMPLCPDTPGENVTFTIRALREGIAAYSSKTFPCEWPLGVPTPTFTPAPTSTPQPTRPATGVADFALYE